MNALREVFWQRVDKFLLKSIIALNTYTSVILVYLDLTPSYQTQMTYILPKYIVNKATAQKLGYVPLV